MHHVSSLDNSSLPSYPSQPKPPQLPINGYVTPSDKLPDQPELSLYPDALVHASKNVGPFSSSEVENPSLSVCDYSKLFSSSDVVYILPFTTRNGCVTPLLIVPSEFEVPTITFLRTFSTNETSRSNIMTRSRKRRQNGRNSLRKSGSFIFNGIVRIKSVIERKWKCINGSFKKGVFL